MHNWWRSPRHGVNGATFIYRDGAGGVRPKARKTRSARKWGRATGVKIGLGAVAGSWMVSATPRWKSNARSSPTATVSRTVGFTPLRSLSVAACLSAFLLALISAELLCVMLSIAMETFTGRHATTCPLQQSKTSNLSNAHVTRYSKGAATVESV